MGEDFSRQTRNFSTAILADCKGKQRGMTGKNRPDGMRRLWMQVLSLHKLT